MQPEKWLRVKELFEVARSLPQPELQPFLAQATGGDAGLRAEVESLLQAYEPALGFLEKPVSSPDPDERLGSYRLVREVGHGGMGTVYLAVRSDDEYQKRVAIKIVRRGLDTDSIIQRFRRERQILAALDHPNISRLLDGGTSPGGRPYLVMEFVEGRAIDRYCGDLKLSVEARLKLFRVVCEAVHFAHRNLIVHRDLKPANILVTQDGTPKLLDFGVSRLLNPEMSSASIDVTGSAQQLMTPEYASPEQVRGENITTSSDIYSLGVLLYRLLTGHSPYRLRTESREEICRAVCEQEPQLPSTSRAGKDNPVTRLAGDLDTIVLKALSKEPARRYGSVEQFSEDVERHLNQMPVLARKDTVRYRAAKFTRRHRVEVASAALVLAALSAGILVALWQANVARAERARAERRFEDVRKLADSYLFEFHDAIQNLPGATPARQLLVKRAVEYLDILARDSGDNVDLQRELAAAYWKLGNVQGQPGQANLGDTQGARKSQLKALEIRLRLAKSGSVQDLQVLAASYLAAGSMLSHTGDTQGGLTYLRNAVAANEALVGKDSGNSTLRIQLAKSYDVLGDLEDGLDGVGTAGDFQGALESHGKALAIYLSLLAADPGDGALRRLAGNSELKTGDDWARHGSPEVALRNYRRALLTFKAEATDPANPKTRRYLANTFYRIGNALLLNGDAKGALDTFRDGLSISQALLTADPKNARARLDLAIGLVDCGEALAGVGDFDAGMGEFRKGLATMQGLATTDPGNTVLQGNLLSSYLTAGEMLKARGYRALARKEFSKATALARAQLVIDPHNSDARTNLAKSLKHEEDLARY